MELETAKQYADGVVIWCGWTETWDNNASWWLVTQQFMAEIATSQAGNTGNQHTLWLTAAMEEALQLVRVTGARESRGACIRAGSKHLGIQFLGGEIPRFNCQAFFSALGSFGRFADRAGRGYHHGFARLPVDGNGDLMRQLRS
jgi:hypothetical protein